MSGIEGAITGQPKIEKIQNVVGYIGLITAMSLFNVLPSFGQSSPDANQAIQNQINQNSINAELARSQAALMQSQLDLQRAQDALKLNSIQNDAALSSARNLLMETDLNGSRSIQNRVTDVIGAARAIPTGTGFFGATKTPNAVGVQVGQNFSNGFSATAQYDTNGGAALGVVWGGSNPADVAKFELAKKTTEEKVALEKAQRDMLLKITNEVNVIMESALAKIDAIDTAVQIQPEVKSKLLKTHLISLTNNLTLKLRECSDISGLQRCAQVFTALAYSNKEDKRVLGAINDSLVVASIALADMDGAKDILRSANDQIASFGISPSSNIANKNQSTTLTQTAFDTTKKPNLPRSIPTSPKSSEVAKN